MRYPPALGWFPTDKALGGFHQPGRGVMARCLRVELTPDIFLYPSPYLVSLGCLVWTCSRQTTAPSTQDQMRVSSLSVGLC